MNYTNAVLAEMVADGAITADERTWMLLLSYPRRKSELLAPFSQAGRFEGLAVEQFEAYTVPDPDWPQYEHDRDGDKLAAKHAGFYRATFMPSLASALEPSRGAKGRQQFIDRLADGLKRRLAEDPAPLRVVAQVLLMSKLDGP
jgi:hypothetical protein